MTKPGRGEVWRVNLDPTKGREQAGTRPALVLSVDAFNEGPAELVIVAPLTTKDKGIKTHVRIEPPMGGCTSVSFIKCEEVRCVSVQRLDRLLGTVDSKVMSEVGYRLRILLEL
jgi:mRNA interferase MazF